MNVRSSAMPEVSAAQIEVMAERIHQGYLDDLSPEQVPGLPAARPWSELAPHEQAQNRQQAWANLERMVTLGYSVAPEAADGGHAVVELPDDEVELLARAEHDRWSAQKYAQGYRFGEERCDDGTPKTHPDLVDWSELDPAAQSKDRNPIRRIPAVLAAAGFVLSR